MINLPKVENKIIQNKLEINIEPDISLQKKVQFLSDNLDNKTDIKNPINLDEIYNSKNNDKFIKTGNKIFYIKSRSTFHRRNKDKNHVIKLKNNMYFNRYLPGCSPYDPYLIKVCKNAIIKVKDQLPNYRDIIKRINTEFGIEEEYIHKRFNNNKLIKTYNTLDEFKTNYTKGNNLTSIKKINLESKGTNKLENKQK